MKFLILSLSLFILASCGPSRDTLQDYMFTTAEGTYVCEEFYSCGTSQEDYCRCEHVLTAKKVSRIRIGADVSVSIVPENTK